MVIKVGDFPTQIWVLTDIVENSFEKAPTHKKWLLDSLSIATWTRSTKDVINGLRFYMTTIFPKELASGQPGPESSFMRTMQSLEEIFSNPNLEAFYLRTKDIVSISVSDGSIWVIADFTENPNLVEVVKVAFLETMWIGSSYKVDYYDVPF